MRQILQYIRSAFKTVLSTLVNSVYWVFHIHQLKKTLVEKKELKTNIKTLLDVGIEITKFTWSEDKPKFIDWNPWIITFINRNKKDDCDGAAVYGKWLFKCVGFKASLYRLISSKSAHIIAITEDKKYMISNNVIMNIGIFIKEGTSWEQFVLDWFNNKYTKIYKTF